jgi:hypothetical protein
MSGSSNNFRITWQFYVDQFLWRDASIPKNGRLFSKDAVYYDHFNLGVSEVSATGAAFT